MRLGLKIGHGVLGLIVIGGTVPLTTHRDDKLDWIRKYGGTQVRSESVHLREYTCYRVDFLFPQGVPSALILELRQRADTGDKTLDAGTECLDLADGLSVQVDQSQPGVIVGWSSSKPWLQQQWETLETRVGLRSRAYPDVLER